MSYELYTTKHWMILPSFVHGILPTLMYNSNNHIALAVFDKKQPYLATAGGEDYIRNAQVTEDGEVIPHYDGWGTNLLAGMKEPFVNIVPIDGPITRNGDACSYGSKDIRDWLMEAAANKYCRAHVLIVNTPGGSAWAKNDFQQAVDFAHENGQRVYMLIDGLCASAGMYLASFCDEVYVVNLKDQLGCVGVMASFFTLKNGDKNQFNSETYHEYYATKSINKNKEYRDIAEDDDATLLIAELDDLETEFRSDVKKSFPNATDEYLDGKIFDADEVMDILCDGQMMLGELVARAFAVANGTEKPIARTANRNIGSPADVTDEDNEDPMENALKSGESAAERIAEIADSKNNVSPKNSKIMTDKKYEIVAQFLEVDELQVTEEGTFLNTPLLDTLAEKLTVMKGAGAAASEETPAQEPAAEPAVEETTPAQEPSAEPAAEETPSTEEETPAEEPAQEPVQEPAAEPAVEPAVEETPSTEEETPAEEPAQEPAQEPAAEPAQEPGAGAEAQAEIDKIQETLHNAEQMVAERDNTIADLQKRFDQTNETLIAAQNTIAERDKVIEGHVATISEKDATIEKLTKQVAALQSEVKELSGKPGSMTNEESGIPAGNGTGEAPKNMGSVKSEITSDMSVEEIRERLRQKDEKQKTYRH